MLQMVFEAVNDTTGPSDLVLTLFVLSAYFCIVTDFSPLVSQQQQANTMIKTMSKLHKFIAQWGKQDAFNARNGLDTIQTLPLAMSLGSKVRIYQKKKDG